VPVQGNSFDLVVSNPPYLARSDAGDLPPELAHEPETALFGGRDGLEIVKRLVAGVGRVLEPGGVFALEIDPAQERAVHACCNEAGLRHVRTLRDLTKRPRVVTARAEGETRKVAPEDSGPVNSRLNPADSPTNSVAAPETFESRIPVRRGV
jgi:methylase of polypeptide subunit release factors